MRRGVERGQSNVVGVAVLLSVTVLAMGALTAGIGAVVDSNAASADAGRVADTFDSALRPVETTGVGGGDLRFTDGHLRTADREVRVLNDSGIVETVAADALVYESGDRRVTFLAGAVVRGRTGGSWLVSEPPVTADRDVLVVGAPRLNASDIGVGGDDVAVRLRTRVTHHRRDLGNGTYRVAVETTTPRAWETAFERLNATTTRRDLDGDGTESVVGRFPGRRTAYLVVHDMRLEVR